MKRSYQKELMDGAPADEKLLIDDLRNLRYMNRFLGGSRVLLYGLKRLIREEKLTSFSLLDVGTGSGDIPAAIARWGRQQSFNTRIVALEAQAVTASVAAGHTKRFPEISVVQCDAGAPPFHHASFDIVTASQFLHHFTEANIIALLQRWAALARRAIVISDLIRHPVAYYGIQVLTRLCTRNVMTIRDAPLSVHRALTVGEWRNLFIHAAVGRVEIRSIAPFRMSAVISLKPS
ncbi:MAG: methyltransferase domain-containing protein [Candidatus Binatia bacterium]